MDLIPDVSSYQHSVDWSAVIRSGRVGGICKATEGLGYVDPTFAGNWAALGRLNAVRGAYCFARPDSAVPEATADKFLSVVGPAGGGDILVLDLEVGSGDLSTWALTWLGRVRARTDVTPMLYSYAPFIRAHLTNSALAGYPLWLAAYQTNPPLAPPPWQTWRLWQHTDKANVPGIAGNCDESMGLLVKAAPPTGGPDMANVIGALADPQVPGGVWVFANDGGVFAYNGARFLGSYPGLPPEQRQGTRTFSRPPTLNDRGGYTFLSDANEPYAFS